MNALRLFVMMQPVFALAGYAMALSGYTAFLDPRFNFLPPATAGAPEDILGFGFWFTWLLLLVWFTPGWLAGYRATGARNAVYWHFLAGLFVLFSALDFFLYQTLESQVLQPG
jgi:hypothetical protein